MKLSDLIEALSPLQVTGGAEQEIRGLFCDSRKVEPGGLFFALKGTASDGHLFINAAVERGAAAIVLEDCTYLRTGFPCLLVSDARLAMARSAARYHGDPTSRQPLVGITGTNGKTTTSYLVEAILESGGLPAAVLGTISYRFGNSVIEASHTTPESTELQSALKILADAGARSFVMEVSSHALEQKRVDGCHFDVGVFTNLTRDHLDYHGTMESYLAAKLRLFSDLLRPTEGKPRRRAVVNMDDPYGAVVAANAACPVITYGVDYRGDVRAEDVSFSVSGIAGRLVTPQGATSFSSRLVGRFNLANILAAAGVGSALELPLAAIKKGIESHQTVPGRLERVENDRGITVLVDYAHTGDALENVLKTLNELKSGRIITVFGCGGDRDRGKRPLMGGIAGRLSDLAIITSDNPRTEEPLSIVAQVRDGMLPEGIREYRPDDIADGFSEKGFVVIVDRREAIRRAIRIARHGDIVLLAGKGHEDYQIIGTTKHHFDDREVSASALKELS
jgi:UDP-N-acetylmuramoyl-L-alanyl-D-glutamate--2,6-diaminopimelate ligase